MRREKRRDLLLALLAAALAVALGARIRPPEARTEARMEAREEEPGAFYCDETMDAAPREAVMAEWERWFDLDYHGAMPDALYTYLLRQRVDEDHGAFLVDTGGRYGTVLVTATHGPWRTDRESGGYAVTFSVWDPRDAAAPIQVLESETLEAGRHWTGDFDFDGAEDFGYLYTAGTGFSSWRFWLWDEARGGFAPCPVLSAVPSPGFDAARRLVTGRVRYMAGSGGEITQYRWQDGGLRPVRRLTLSQESPEDTRQRFTVEAALGAAGRMTEIHRELLDKASMWEDGRPWQAWYDADYWGEPDDACRLLLRQTIDETHDARLVPTGGRLGTLLVTAAWGGGAAGEPLRLAVWDPAEPDAPRQTIELAADCLLSAYVADCSFDGHPDIGLILDRGVVRYCVWQEAAGQFVVRTERELICDYTGTEPGEGGGK